MTEMRESGAQTGSSVGRSRLGSVELLEHEDREEEEEEEEGEWLTSFVLRDLYAGDVEDLSAWSEEEFGEPQTERARWRPDRRGGHVARQEEAQLEGVSLRESAERIEAGLKVQVNEFLQECQKAIDAERKSNEVIQSSPGGMLESRKAFNAPASLVSSKGQMLTQRDANASQPQHGILASLALHICSRPSIARDDDLQTFILENLKRQSVRASTDGSELDSLRQALKETILNQVRHEQVGGSKALSELVKLLERIVFEHKSVLGVFDLIDLYLEVLDNKGLTEERKGLLDAVLDNIKRASPKLWTHSEQNTSVSAKRSSSKEELHLVQASCSSDWTPVHVVGEREATSSQSFHRHVHSGVVINYKPMVPVQDFIFRVNKEKQDRLHTRPRQFLTAKGMLRHSLAAYEDPDLNARVLFRLSEGDRVLLLGKKASWLRVMVEKVHPQPFSSSLEVESITRMEDLVITGTAIHSTDSISSNAWTSSSAVETTPRARTDTEHSSTSSTSSSSEAPSFGTPTYCWVQDVPGLLEKSSSANFFLQHGSTVSCKDSADRDSNDPSSSTPSPLTPVPISSCTNSSWRLEGNIYAMSRCIDLLCKIYRKVADLDLENSSRASFSEFLLQAFYEILAVPPAQVLLSEKQNVFVTMLLQSMQSHLTASLAIKALVSGLAVLCPTPRHYREVLLVALDDAYPTELLATLAARVHGASSSVSLPFGLDELVLEGGFHDAITLLRSLFSSASIDSFANAGKLSPSTRSRRQKAAVKILADLQDALFRSARNRENQLASSLFHEYAVLVLRKCSSAFCSESISQEKLRDSSMLLLLQPLLKALHLAPFTYTSLYNILGCLEQVLHSLRNPRLKSHGLSPELKSIETSVFHLFGACCSNGLRCVDTTVCATGDGQGILENVLDSPLLWGGESFFDKSKSSITEVSNVTNAMLEQLYRLVPGRVFLPPKSRIDLAMKRVEVATLEALCHHCGIFPQELVVDKRENGAFSQPMDENEVQDHQARHTIMSVVYYCVRQAMHTGQQMKWWKNALAELSVYSNDSREKDNCIDTLLADIQPGQLSFLLKAVQPTGNEEDLSQEQLKASIVKLLYDYQSNPTLLELSHLNADATCFDYVAKKYEERATFLLGLAPKTSQSSFRFPAAPNTCDSEFVSRQRARTELPEMNRSRKRSKSLPPALERTKHKMINWESVFDCESKRPQTPRERRSEKKPKQTSFRSNSALRLDTSTEVHSNLPPRSPLSAARAPFPSTPKASSSSSIANARGSRKTYQEWLRSTKASPPSQTPKAVEALKDQAQLVLAFLKDDSLNLDRIRIELRRREAKALGKYRCMLLSHRVLKASKSCWYYFPLVKLLSDAFHSDGHYVAGIEGCGIYLASKIRNQFIALANEMLQEVTSGTCAQQNVRPLCLRAATLAYKDAYNDSSLIRDIRLVSTLKTVILANLCNRPSQEEDCSGASKSVQQSSDSSLFTMRLNSTLDHIDHNTSTLLVARLGLKTICDSVVQWQEQQLQEEILGALFEIVRELWQCHSSKADTAPASSLSPRGVVDGNVEESCFQFLDEIQQLLEAGIGAKIHSLISSDITEWVFSSNLLNTPRVQALLFKTLDTISSRFSLKFPRFFQLKLLDTLGKSLHRDENKNPFGCAQNENIMVRVRPGPSERASWRERLFSETELGLLGTNPMLRKRGLTLEKCEESFRFDQGCQFCVLHGDFSYPVSIHVQITAKFTKFRQSAAAAAGGGTSTTATTGTTMSTDTRMLLHGVGANLPLPRNPRTRQSVRIPTHVRTTRLEEQVETASESYKYSDLALSLKVCGNEVSSKTMTMNAFKVMVLEPHTQEIICSRVVPFSDIRKRNVIAELVEQLPVGWRVVMVAAGIPEEVSLEDQVKGGQKQFAHSLALLGSTDAHFVAGRVLQGTEEPWLWSFVGEKINTATAKASSRSGSDRQKRPEHLYVHGSTSGPGCARVVWNRPFEKMHVSPHHATQHQASFIRIRNINKNKAVVVTFHTKQLNVILEPGDVRVIPHEFSQKGSEDGNGISVQIDSLFGETTSVISQWWRQGTLLDEQLWSKPSLRDEWAFQKYLHPELDPFDASFGVELVLGDGQDASQTLPECFGIITEFTKRRPGVNLVPAGLAMHLSQNSPKCLLCFGGKMPCEQVAERLATRGHSVRVLQRAENANVRNTRILHSSCNDSAVLPPAKTSQCLLPLLERNCSASSHATLTILESVVVSFARRLLLDGQLLDVIEDLVLSARDGLSQKDLQLFLGFVHTLCGRPKGPVRPEDRVQVLSNIPSASVQSGLVGWVKQTFETRCVVQFPVVSATMSFVEQQIQSDELLVLEAVPLDPLFATTLRHSKFSEGLPFCFAQAMRDETVSLFHLLDALQLLCGHQVIRLASLAESGLLETIKVLCGSSQEHSWSPHALQQAKRILSGLQASQRLDESTILATGNKEKDRDRSADTVFLGGIDLASVKGVVSVSKNEEEACFFSKPTVPIFATTKETIPIQSANVRVQFKLPKLPGDPSMQNYFVGLWSRALEDLGKKHSPQQGSQRFWCEGSVAVDVCNPSVLTWHIPQVPTVGSLVDVKNGPSWISGTVVEKNGQILCVEYNADQHAQVIELDDVSELEESGFNAEQKQEARGTSPSCQNLRTQKDWFPLDSTRLAPAGSRTQDRFVSFGSQSAGSGNFRGYLQRSKLLQQAGAKDDLGDSFSIWLDWNLVEGTLSYSRDGLDFFPVMTEVFGCFSPALSISSTAKEGFEGRYAFSIQVEQGETASQAAELKHHQAFSHLKTQIPPGRYLDFGLASCSCMEKRNAAVGLQAVSRTANRDAILFELLEGGNEVHRVLSLLLQNEARFSQPLSPDKREQLRSHCAGKTHLLLEARSRLFLQHRAWKIGQWDVPEEAQFSLRKPGPSSTAAPRDKDDPPVGFVLPVSSEIDIEAIRRETPSGQRFLVLVLVSEEEDPWNPHLDQRFLESEYLRGIHVLVFVIRQLEGATILSELSGAESTKLHFSMGNRFVEYLDENDALEPASQPHSSEQEIEKVFHALHVEHCGGSEDEQTKKAVTTMPQTLREFIFGDDTTAFSTTTTTTTKRVASESSTDPLLPEFVRLRPSMSPEIASAHTGERPQTPRRFVGRAHAALSAVNAHDRWRDSIARVLSEETSLSEEQVAETVARVQQVGVREVEADLGISLPRYGDFSTEFVQPTPPPMQVSTRDGRDGDKGLSAVSLEERAQSLVGKPARLLVDAKSLRELESLEWLFNPTRSISSPSKQQGMAGSPRSRWRSILRNALETSVSNTLSPQSKARRGGAPEPLAILSAWIPEMNSLAGITENRSLLCLIIRVDISHGCALVRCDNPGQGVSETWWVPLECLELGPQACPLDLSRGLSALQEEERKVCASLARQVLSSLTEIKNDSAVFENLWRSSFLDFFSHKAVLEVALSQGMRAIHSLAHGFCSSPDRTLSVGYPELVRLKGEFQACGYPLTGLLNSLVTLDLQKPKAKNLHLGSVVDQKEPLELRLAAEGQASVLLFTHDVDVCSVAQHSSGRSPRGRYGGSSSARRVSPRSELRNSVLSFLGEESSDDERATVEDLFEIFDESIEMPRIEVYADAACTVLLRKICKWIEHPNKAAFLGEGGGGTLGAQVKLLRIAQWQKALYERRPLIVQGGAVYVKYVTSSKESQTRRQSLFPEDFQLTFVDPRLLIALYFVHLSQGKELSSSDKERAEEVVKLCDWILSNLAVNPVVPDPIRTVSLQAVTPHLAALERLVLADAQSIQLDIQRLASKHYKVLNEEFLSAVRTEQSGCDYSKAPLDGSSTEESYSARVQALFEAVSTLECVLGKESDGVRFLQISTLLAKGKNLKLLEEVRASIELQLPETTKILISQEEARVSEASFQMVDDSAFEQLKAQFKRFSRLHSVHEWRSLAKQVLEWNLLFLKHRAFLDLRPCRITDGWCLAACVSRCRELLLTDLASETATNLMWRNLAATNSKRPKVTVDRWSTPTFGRLDTFYSGTSLGCALPVVQPRFCDPILIARESCSFLENRESRTRSSPRSRGVKEELPLFEQAFRQLKDIPAEHFRQQYSSPHIAFEVRFSSEHVAGEAGPWREFFTFLSHEIHDVNASCDACTLGLLVMTPNQQIQCGEFRDRFIPRPSFVSPEGLSRFRFLGRLMGCALQTGVLFPLRFAPLVWKKLCDVPVDRIDLEHVDATLTNVVGLEEGVRFETEFALSDRVQLRLKHPISGAAIEQLRLGECDAQIEAMRAGLMEIIPGKVLGLLTWHALERMLCGSPTIDVELLRRNTVYGGLSESAPHVKFFWQVMEELPNDKLVRFIRFAWGQERLPVNDAEFKKRRVRMLLKSPSPSMPNQDQMLPRADTCFFNVMLPCYSTLDVTRDRLLTAINLDFTGLDGDDVML